MASRNRPNVLESHLAGGWRWGTAAVALWALLVAGAFIWIPGYWHDEAATVVIATRPWGEFLETLTHADAVHAFYYLLMRPWLAIFGTSTLAARIPSALAVAATSMVLLKLGRLAIDRRTGYAAAILYPVIPAAMWMAGEARSFAMAGLAISVLMLAGLVATQRDHGLARWAAVAATTAVSGWLFLFSLLSAPALLLLARTRRDAARMAAALLVGGVMVLPLVIWGGAQRGQVSWIGQRSVVQVLASMFAGQYFSADKIIAAALWAVVVAGWVAMARRGRWREVTAVAAAIALPNAALLLSGFVADHTYYVSRYLTFTTPFVALLIGVGVTRTSKRWLRWAAIGLLVVALGFAPFMRRFEENAKSGWLYAMDVIEPRRQPGDAWISYHLMSTAGLVYPTFRMPLLNAQPWGVISRTVGSGPIPDIGPEIRVVWYVPAARPGKPSMDWVEGDVADLKRQGFTVTLVAPEATVDRVSVFRAERG